MDIFNPQVLCLWHCDNLCWYFTNNYEFVLTS